MFIAIYLAFHRIHVSESVTGIGKTVLQIKFYCLTFRQEIYRLLFYACQFILLQLTDFLYFKLSIIIHTSDNKCHISFHILMYMCMHTLFSPSSTDPVYASQRLNLF